MNFRLFSEFQNMVLMVPRQCGSQFVIYIKIELLCSVPEIKIMLYPNFISIKKVKNGFRC